MPPFEGMVRAEVLSCPEDLSAAESECAAMALLWKELAQRFLHGCDAGVKTEHQRLYHKSTHWWMQSVDHALQLFTGRGLEQFCTKATADKYADVDGLHLLAEQNRCLSIVADQCGVGLSAATFMDQVMHLRAELVFDLPHRTWNSEKNALTAGGAWETVLLTTSLFNVSYGPWLSGGWGSTLQGARREMASICSPSCPLFQALLPSMARDRNEESELHDPAYAERLWSEICDPSGPLAAKGPRNSLCRWYGWYDCVQHWRRHWHQRLLVMLYWAISTKTLTGEIGSATLKLGKLSKDRSGGDQRQTMKEAQAKTVAVKSGGKNQLHVATLIALNPVISRRSFIIFELLTPMRIAHGTQ
eukprot:4081762-Amphidinium_carterae.1